MAAGKTRWQQRDGTNKRKGAAGPAHSAQMFSEELCASNKSPYFSAASYWQRRWWMCGIIASAALIGKRILVLNRGKTLPWEASGHRVNAV